MADALTVSTRLDLGSGPAEVGLGLQGNSDHVLAVVGHPQRRLPSAAAVLRRPAAATLAVEPVAVA